MLNMGHNNNFILALLIFLCIKCERVSGENGTNDGDLNGEKLMDIGRELRLPMLRIIGKTIDNTERNIEAKLCDLHPCSQWTEWSSCVVRFGQIGWKFRTRQCNVNMTSCEIESTSRTEKKFGICTMDMNCPYDYNITKNGFCMKLVADKYGPKQATEQQCQKDGGHLVNIDSEMKLEDVSSLLTGFRNRYIWIDGERKDVSSPWEYTYGSQKRFFKWYTNEPSNGSHDLCLAITFYRYFGLTWDDVTCSDSKYSICEIILTT
jgi:hypothetical protein